MSYWCILTIIYVFPGSVEFKALSYKVANRLNQAYRPSTRSNQRSQFRTFLAFCIYYHIDLNHIALPHILGFIELCANSGVSHKTINNYVSGLKVLFNKYNLPVHILDQKDVYLMLFSCSKNLRYVPLPKGIFTIQHLTAIIQHCSLLQYPKVYKAIFLLAFHGFLGSLT